MAWEASASDEIVRQRAGTPAGQPPRTAALLESARRVVVSIYPRMMLLPLNLGAVPPLRLFNLNLILSRLVENG
jgi:hypothetical protein